MQLDFLADLTNEMRVETIQHVAHTFDLLETSLLLVQFLYLIVESYNLLFEFFIVGEVPLPKFYEIVGLSVRLVCSTLKF